MPLWSEKASESLPYPEAVFQLSAEGDSSPVVDDSTFSGADFVQVQEPPILHSRLTSLLNIKANTSRAGKTKSHSIPVVSHQNSTNCLRTRSEHLQRCRNFSTMVVSNRSSQPSNLSGLSLLFAYSMFLATKIDEVRPAILDLKPNLSLT